MRLSYWQGYGVQQREMKAGFYLNTEKNHFGDELLICAV